MTKEEFRNALLEVSEYQSNFVNEIIEQMVAKHFGNKYIVIDINDYNKYGSNLYFNKMGRDPDPDEISHLLNNDKLFNTLIGLNSIEQFNNFQKEVLLFIHEQIGDFCIEKNY
jgi:hypothetical protein